jgi:hypothetical protein
VIKKGTRAFFAAGFFFLIAGCSTSFLKYDKAEQLNKNDEFEDAVKIVKPAEDGTAPTVAVTPTPTPTPSPTPVAENSKHKKTKKSKKQKAAEEKQLEAAAAAAAAAVPVGRQPDLEDSEGFNGRRPINDPFHVGEEVVHDVTYFKVSAGELRMKVAPYAQVNGRKSYNFQMAIKTSSLFSAFYSVEDKVETLVDFDNLVPSVFELHVKETDQLREAKFLFNFDTDKATFWEKKVTKKSGVEEKKVVWDILPYSQNVYSAVFYMRFFKWDLGKKYSYRVANDEENLVFSGEAIRREVLDTKLGPMKAIVIKPEIYLKGKFKTIGDNYIWLSDDEHKYILRIESKIKIGTLVSQVVQIKPGN